MCRRISTLCSLFSLARAAPPVASAHQSSLHGIESSLGPALQLKLAEDVAPMSLHRLLLDPELASDLFVRLASRHEPRDGSLAFGERLGTPRDLHLQTPGGGGLG